MHKFSTLLLSVYVSLLPYNLGAKYGETCSYDSDCSGPYSYSSFRGQKCDKGRCNCSDSSELRYSHGAVSCSSEFDIISGYCFGFSYSSSDTQCKKDQECIKNRCRCVNGLFKVGHECFSRTFVKPFKKCFIDSHERMIKGCDTFGDNTFCDSGKCVCFKKYFYNFTSSVCEDKKKFTDLHKISTYKALPKGYCLNSKDCVEGLDCKNHVCACPSRCSYKEEKLICDCGEVALEAPTAVTVVGVILGLVFSTCWCCIIKKSIKKHRNKSERLGMSEMTCRDEASSSSSSEEETTTNVPVDESPKQMPMSDQPPPYSSVVCPVQPQVPSKPPPYNPASYPTSPYYSDVTPQPPAYPDFSGSAPISPVGGQPAESPEHGLPYPVKPSQDPDPNRDQNPPYPTTDQRAPGSGYPADLQPSAPVGFESGSQQPDLSFQTPPAMQPTPPAMQQTPPTMQPTPPSYPLNPK